MIYNQATPPRQPFLFWLANLVSKNKIYWQPAFFPDAFPLSEWQIAGQMGWRALRELQWPDLAQLHFRQNCRRKPEVELGKYNVTASRGRGPKPPRNNSSCGRRPAQNFQEITLRHDPSCFTTWQLLLRQLQRLFFLETCHSLRIDLDIIILPITLATLVCT